MKSIQKVECGEPRGIGSNYFVPCSLEASEVLNQAHRAVIRRYEYTPNGCK